jgi:tetratricopeptide (TPR) repeat protein
VLDEATDGAAAAGAKGVRARCLVVRASLRFYTNPADAVAEAEAVASRAIRVFRELGDEVGMAQAWNLLAYASATRGRWGGTIERYEEALLHAERAGYRREQSSILSLLPLALLYGPTPADEAIGRCEVILARASEDVHLEAAVGALLAPLLAMQERFDEARALAQEATGRLAELGTLGWLASARAHVGQVELLAGRAGDAERELRLAHETFDGIGDRVNAAAAAALLAEALAAQGRDAEAESWTELPDEAVVAGDVLAQVTWGTARAKALARAGRVDEAERLAHEIAAIADDTDALNMRGDATLALATVLRSAGRDDEAAAAAVDALTLYGAKGNLAAVARVEEWLAEWSGLTAEAAPGGRPAPRPAQA